MSTNSPNLSNRNYLQGLDTVRGIAILGIVLYHLVPHVFSGGFLGVNLFFVLSGFLINRSLEREYKSNSEINYIKFFSRRLGKLFAPMFWMIIIVAAFLFVFQENLLNNYLGESISALLFFNNWWQIGMGSSYFMKFMNPSTITHLWYLSVQVQLYIIWVVVFILTKKYSEKTRSNQAPTVYLVITILSAVLMAILFTPGKDPTRVYYGTDTRIFSFAFGALLSLYHRDRTPGREKNERTVSKRRKKAQIRPFGIISLIVIVIMYLTVLDSASFTFRGGMLLCTFFSGCLIFAAVNPRMTISNLFESSIVLKGLGKRSYSIYLWYYPVMIIFQVMTKGKSISGFWGGVLQMAILLIIAQISYVLFEKNYIMIPLYQFEGVKKELGKLKMTWLDRNNFRLIPKLLFLICTVFICTAVVGVSTFKPNNEAAEDLQAKIQANQQKLAKKKAEKKSPEKTEEKGEKSSDKKSSSAEDNQPSEIEGLTKGELKFAQNLDITFIGDSMLLMAVDPIGRIFPKAEVDGAVGRQLYQSGAVVDTLKAQNRLHNTVVIILGANGSFTESQFDQFLSNIGKDKNIFLVTTNANTEWKDSVNQSFVDKAKENKHIHIVDWNSYLGNNTDWLEPDGTHPNLQGAEKMTVLIAKEIYKDENGGKDSGKSKEEPNDKSEKKKSESDSKSKKDKKSE